MIAHAMTLVDAMRAARAEAGSLLVGLDFDGTLAPIVPRPENAALPADARAALERLAARRDTDVALVSGRSLADLRRRADLEGVYYAGNHGLEIEGPDVHRVHRAASDARDELAALAQELEAALAHETGIIVEDKGLTLSVHYRLARDADAEARVRERVHACGAAYPALRLTDGRKIVEIKPAVDWHKGRAFRFLRETLAARHRLAPALFIGDDRTDEDAFAELGDADWPIIVGDPPRPDTHARSALRTPEEVAVFLDRLSAP